MKIQNLFLTTLVAGALAAHAGPNAEIITNVGNNVILRTYLDLAIGAKTLETAVQALAQQPDGAKLAVAQQAWRDMRSPWEASEAFIFGPVESLSIDPTIDTWPLNKRDLDGILNSGRPLTLDFVRNLGVNLQGFHVTEYLLFGNGDTGPSKTVAEFSLRQYEYLLATTTLLVENTVKLANAWEKNANPDFPSQPGYAFYLSQPSRTNPYYKTEGAVMVELVKGMIAIVDEVGNGKLTDPMGGNIGAADPTLVESPFSWNSLADFTDNIRSVLNVYTGSYGTTVGKGIRDFVATHDAKLAGEFEQRIHQSMQKIIAIAGPENLDFRQAIVSPIGRARIEAAILDLNDLQRMIEKKLLPLVENLD